MKFRPQAVLTGPHCRLMHELLPRLPSCQPRRQPALVKLLACVSWRGNYLLSRHSIYSIYSIYRYLQQHCVMAETHHSQLSAAREVGKNYQTLVNKFFSLRISNQDCVLCFVFFMSSQSCGVPLPVPPSAIFVECAILGPLVAGGCTCLKFPEPPGVSRP